MLAHHFSHYYSRRSHHPLSGNETEGSLMNNLHFKVNFGVLQTLMSHKDI